MAKINISDIVNIVIAFLLMGLLLPIGLNALFDMVLPEGIDASITTILQLVCPILAILGIVLKFVKDVKS